MITAEARPASRRTSSGCARAGRKVEQAAAAAERRGRGHLRAADHHRDCQGFLGPHPRSVRPGAACHPLSSRDDLDRLIDEINESGYGLTFGLHTRLDETIAHVTSRIKAGNPLCQPQHHRRGGRRAAVRQHILSRTDFGGSADACRARRISGLRLALPGPTGEDDSLRFTARGTIAGVATTPACRTRYARSPAATACCSRTARPRARCGLPCPMRCTAMSAWIRPGSTGNSTRCCSTAARPRPTRCACASRHARARSCSCCSRRPTTT